MRLYDFKLAPNPRRVRVFAAEKGIALDTVTVDLGNRGQFEDGFRAVNPRCAVPVLELDDGTRINESVAICRYLEETHPEPPLMDRGYKSGVGEHGEIVGKVRDVAITTPGPDVDVSHEQNRLIFGDRFGVDVVESPTQVLAVLVLAAGDVLETGVGKLRRARFGYVRAERMDRTARVLNLGIENAAGRAPAEGEGHRVLLDDLVFRMDGDAGLAFAVGTLNRFRLLTTVREVDLLDDGSLLVQRQRIVDVGLQYFFL